MIKYLYVFLLLLPLNLSAKNGHLYTFSRPLKVLDSYHFEGAIQVEEKIDILSPNEHLNSSRSQFFTAQSEGFLWVKNVNDAGHPTIFDVDLCKVEASYAGAKLHHQLNGARISVDFSAKSQRPFRRHDTMTISKNELTILKQIFRPPPKENLNELLFGPDSMQKKGVWQPCKKTLLTRFNAEKLNATADHLQVEASVREIDSELLLKLEVESKNLKNFDFYMTMSLLLPYDNELPVRTSLRETRYSSLVKLDHSKTNALMPTDAKMRRSTHEVVRFDMSKNTR